MFTIQELTQVIKKLQPQKAPGSDLITVRMLQEKPQEGFKTLLHIFNTIRRLQYWPAPLKQAKMIMIPKPGKDPTDVASYRPISLLPLLSKILEKLLLKRIYNDTNLQNWVPSHQFGFRKAHSTVQQCHCITDIINIWKTQILFSSLPGRQPSIWRSLAPGSPIQNQTNLVHRIPKHTKILP